MTTLSVALTDPSGTFTPSTSGTDGPLIDELRDNCGFVIQGVDWVCRKLGFDLIGAIFNPIAGDYDAVDAMASNWGVLGAGLGQIGGNYRALGGAAPQVWTGDASTAAVAKLSSFAHGFATQAEGAQLVSTAMQDMLAATKSVVELLADLLSMVDEAVLMLLSSALRLAKELATGGATVRRIISLVGRAIEAVKTLENVVPPLLQACQIMATMMKGLDAVFLVGNVAANSSSGSKVDDIAHAGFPS